MIRFVYKYGKMVRYAGSNDHFPHKLRGRSHLGTGYHESPAPQREIKRSMGDQEGCKLDLELNPNSIK
jgi:hypothetical protein